MPSDLQSAADLRRELDEARARIAALEAELARSSSRGAPTYDADHLTVWHKIPGFMQDERFLRAYRKGMDSGHAIGRPAGSDIDIHIEWRIAVCCWAGRHGTRLPGDFVECGTNTGIMSLAVCDYVDFNSTAKDFWLFDTFAGIPREKVLEEERAIGRLGENIMYPECFEIAKANFAPYPKAHLVRGTVPESLATVDIGDVAYLCIDLNIAAPERAALEHFWPKLMRGAVVIFDDYGWTPYYMQKRFLDEFATSQGVEILTLPTGQGLLVKP